MILLQGLELLVKTITNHGDDIFLDTEHLHMCSLLGMCSIMPIGYLHIGQKNNSIVFLATLVFYAITVMHFLKTLL